MAYADYSSGFFVKTQVWVEKDYRIRVPALITISVVILVVVRMFGMPEWLVFLSLPPLLFATLATYHRLRQRDRSGWWILLMIAHFGFGPEWMGIHLAALINLIPMLLVWRDLEESGRFLETGEGVAQPHSADHLAP